MTPATMTGKSVLITGGTSGIGFETALELAKLGAHVIVTGRDQTRGDEGVKALKDRSGNQTIDLMLADLSSFDAVRQLAHDYQERFDRLDVLVNNVGLLPTQRWETADGIEATLAINHLVPFLLTHELLPILKTSAPSRVVNVTGGNTSGTIDFDNLQAEKSFLALDTYSHAKRVMMAASYEFAHRLEGTGVTVNVVYPGPANTNMTKDMTSDMVPSFMKIVFPIFRRFLSNADPAKAAKSSILAASSPDFAGQTGNSYKSGGKKGSWNQNLIKDDVPKRIWDISVKMIGLEAPAL